MSMVLAIYEDKTKNKSVTRRSLVRVPGNAPLTVVWNGKDLKGQTTAFVPYDAVVPRSRASSLEMAKDMLQAQLITTLPEFVAVADLAGAGMCWRLLRRMWIRLVGRTHSLVWVVSRFLVSGMTTSFTLVSITLIVRQLTSRCWMRRRSR